MAESERECTAVRQMERNAAHLRAGEAPAALALLRQAEARLLLTAVLAELAAKGVHYGRAHTGIHTRSLGVSASPCSSADACDSSYCDGSSLHRLYAILLSWSKMEYESPPASCQGATHVAVALDGARVRRRAGLAPAQLLLAGQAHARRLDPAGLAARAAALRACASPSTSF
jgi:hypothetical protein